MNDGAGAIGGLIAIAIILYIIYLIVVYIILPILAIILGIGLIILGSIVLAGLASGVYVGIVNFINVLIEAHKRLP